MEPRTNSVILFEQHGVVVGVNTVFHVDRVDASISFEAPEGRTVQLLAHQIEVSVAPGNTWNSKLSGHVWTGPGRTSDFPVDAPMIGKNGAWRLGVARGYGNTKHAAFFFKAPLFATPGPETFAMKMPRFRVDNVEVDLPLIEFTLGSEDLWTSLP